MDVISGVIIVQQNQMKVLEYPGWNYVCGEQEWTGDIAELQDMLVDVFGITRDKRLDLLVVSNDKEVTESLSALSNWPVLNDVSYWTAKRLGEIVPNEIDYVVSIYDTVDKTKLWYAWHQGIGDIFSRHTQPKNSKGKQSNDAQELHKTKVTPAAPSETCIEKDNQEESIDLDIQMPSDLATWMNNKTKSYEKNKKI